jgi:hypothetical protein
VVVAKPLAALVEGHEEEVGALDLVQHPLGAILAADGVAERGAEAVEHACLQEEAARLRVLGGDDLVAEIVDQMAVVDELIAIARPGPIAQ